MKTYPSYLPAAERRAATVESVVALAATSNPSEITTAAIATRPWPGHQLHIQGNH